MFFDLHFWHSRRLLYYRPSSLTLQLTCSKVGEYPKPQYENFSRQSHIPIHLVRRNFVTHQGGFRISDQSIFPRKNWELCSKAFGPTLCHKSYIFLSIPKPAKSRFLSLMCFLLPNTRFVFVFWVVQKQDISYIPKRIFAQLPDVTVLHALGKNMRNRQIGFIFSQGVKLHPRNISVVGTTYWDSCDWYIYCTWMGDFWLIFRVEGKVNHTIHELAGTFQGTITYPTKRVPAGKLINSKSAVYSEDMLVFWRVSSLSSSS